MHRRFSPAALALVVGLLSTGAFAASSNYGTTMPEGEAQPLSAAITGFTADVEAPRKYAGRVAKVCRKKGCWLELEDDGHSARVTMLDYGFFLPTDAQGTAEIYGTLSLVDLDEATRAHYAKDAGVNVDDVATREYRLVAHAITLNSP